MKQQIFDKKYTGQTQDVSHNCAIGWLENFLATGNFEITALNIYTVKAEGFPNGWRTYLTGIAEQKE